MWREIKAITQVVYVLKQIFKVYSQNRHFISAQLINRSHINHHENNTLLIRILNILDL